MIFRLPDIVSHDGFPVEAPRNWPKIQLAYITWYTRFGKAPDPVTGMYTVTSSTDSKGKMQGCVVPIAQIRQICMLTPHRGDWNQQWDSTNILDLCPSFFVNNLQSKYSFQTIY